jgi:hypothetical protein
VAFKSYLGKKVNIGTVHVFLSISNILRHNKKIKNVSILAVLDPEPDPVPTVRIRLRFRNTASMGL